MQHNWTVSSEKVAGEAYELTELTSREILRAQLASRGLAPIFVEHRPVVPQATRT